MASKYVEVRAYKSTHDRLNPKEDTEFKNLGTAKSNEELFNKITKARDYPGYCYVGFIADSGEVIDRIPRAIAYLAQT